MQSLSVVIPVYNSARILPELVQRLAPVLDQCGASYEVILVNDGSRDDSWPVIVELTATYTWLRGLNLMRNYGQHNALLCGARAARHEITVTMDDDLQNPPEEIPRLLAKLNEGYDVVYGTPEQEQHGIWRDVLSKLTKSAMSRAMSLENVRDISAFRAFRTDLRRAFANYQSPSLLLDVLLSWGTAKFVAVKVAHHPRHEGLSNYNFWRLLNHALSILTGFSTAPLRIASFIGFGLTLFGVGVLIYAVGRYLLQGDKVPGFPFLASVIAIFSGAQLFTLGIIGEYLARMFNRSLERPVYVVADDTQDDAEKLP